MLLKYIGRHTAGVHLAMPDGTETPVAHGGTVEVTDEHGESLLEQAENWIKAEISPPAKDPKTPPAKDAAPAEAPAKNGGA